MSYLFKYAPKYYKSLTIDIMHYNPLFSKIKNIKRIKRFTGLYKQNLPQKLWLNLLGSTRKDLEEIPFILNNGFDPDDNIFCEKLYLQSTRSFLNITRLDTQKVETHLGDYERFMNPMIRDSCIKNLRTLRSLKEFKIFVNSKNFNDIQWLFRKLNRMDTLLKTLDNLKLEIVWKDVPVSEFLQYKNVARCLTSLKFTKILTEFDPNICIIPQACLNLRSLSIGFERFFTESLEFPSFLRSVQELPKIISLDLTWSKDLRLFWRYFKPQNSLKYLALNFDASEILSEGLFEMENPLKRDLFKNWENEIKELENLELKIRWKNPEDLTASKVFITRMLKKVNRLVSFKCEVDLHVQNIESPDEYELFSVDEVPHLYESLERFEAGVRCFSYLDSHSGLMFDSRKMKPFKNLKAIGLTGDELNQVNLEEAILLLQENQKEREYPVLELKVTLDSTEDLRLILEGISKAKRSDKNLKIVLDLCYKVSYTSDEYSCLDECCKAIQDVKPIKGLVISLDFGFSEKTKCLAPKFSQVGTMMKRYLDIRNLMFSMSYYKARLEYVKIDGEKEQLFEECF